MWLGVDAEPASRAQALIQPLPAVLEPVAERWAKFSNFIAIVAGSAVARSPQIV
jgi:hypothetical protein